MISPREFISDSEINFALLFRLSQTFFGILIIFLLPIYLNELEQGVYFTFLSLTAAQIFFELGLNQVVIQNVSSYKGELTLNNSKKDISSISAKIFILHSKLLKIYLILAFAFIAIVGPIGYFIFKNSIELSLINWLLPWSALVLLTGFNLYLSPLLSFHEGLGRVTPVYKLRFIQTVIGSTFLILLLIWGFNLFSIIALPFISFIFSFIWLNLNFNHIKKFKEFINKKNDFNFSWYNEIFALQWRVSLSWISGYFIFYFLQPVIFSVYGPVIAGKFGISFNILRVASNLCISWLSPKLPELSRLYFSKKKRSMNNLFLRYSKNVIQISFISFLGINFAHYLLGIYDSELQNRFLDYEHFFVLTLICFIDICIYCLATYTRAFKEEPFYKISVFAAILAVLTGLLANFITFYIFLLLRLIANLLIILPWSYKIFNNYWAR